MKNYYSKYCKDDLEELKTVSDVIESVLLDIKSIVGDEYTEEINIVLEDKEVSDKIEVLSKKLLKLRESDKTRMGKIIGEYEIRTIIIRQFPLVWDKYNENSQFYKEYIKKFKYV